MFASLVPWSLVIPFPLVMLILGIPYHSVLDLPVGTVPRWYSYEVYAGLSVTRRYGPLLYSVGTATGCRYR